MSSLLCSISAIFWEDVVKPHTNPMSDRRATFITQSSVVLFGVLSIAVAFLVSGLTGPISQIIDTTESSLVGGVCGVFILGWLIPWANTTGALVGGFVSVLFVGWISFGQYTSSGVRVAPQLTPASVERCQFPNSTDLFDVQTNDTMYLGDNNIQTVAEPHGLDLLYSLSYKWLGAVGIVIVIVVGSLVSRLQAPRPVDPSLVVPICDLLCCCIPSFIRKRLGFGVNHTHNDDRTSEKAEGESPDEKTSPSHTLMPLMTNDEPLQALNGSGI
ncbi:sodium-coupled monocarboxylate transporter 2-like [Pecten maximus]|uniref:sodium-coupled monocarboxylate transporter 2-like n=1 Tax=Pecten maximus TaxID=6579 RepID=UPI0014584AC9|nr:sodium-coupled monocarboxylate transporter 2-like [Pecten maximus]